MKGTRKLLHTLRLLGPARFGRLAVRSLLSHNPVHLWDEEAEFLELMRLVEPHTLLDRRRAHVLWQLALQARGMEGDAAEVGVYRGGTALLLARVLGPAGRTLHLFDTFEGMPASDGTRDFVKEGDFADTSAESVRALLPADARVELHAGLFPGTAEAVAGRRFSLVHLDVDRHRSVLDGCAFFHPRLVRGGLLVFDDYGFLSCEGAREAVDSFFADKPERPVYLPTGQALVVKI